MHIEPDVRAMTQICHFQDMAAPDFEALHCALWHASPDESKCRAVAHQGPS